MTAYMPQAKTVEWGTPRDLFAKLNAEFVFDLDPASTHENAKCPRHYTTAEDGLLQPWDGSVFVNPPYGAAIAQWVDKALRELHRCRQIVMLLPARTDTAWFHRILENGAEVRFIKGRLRFETSGGGGSLRSGHLPEYYRGAAGALANEPRPADRHRLEDREPAPDENQRLPQAAGRRDRRAAC